MDESVLMLDLVLLLRAPASKSRGVPGVLAFRDSSRACIASFACSALRFCWIASAFLAFRGDCGEFNEVVIVNFDGIFVVLAAPSILKGLGFGGGCLMNRKPGFTITSWVAKGNHNELRAQLLILFR